MPRKLTMLIGVSAVVCAVHGVRGADGPKKQAGAPSVVNPSMEEVSPKRALPKGWYFNGAGIAATDDTVAHTGRRSIKLCFRGPREAPFVSQGVAVPRRANVVYRITAKVRTLDLAGEAYLFVYRYPPPFKKRFMSKKISGTHAWRTLSLDVPAKPGGDSLQVRLMAYATWGQVWLDDVTVEMLEKPK